MDNVSVKDHTIILKIDIEKNRKNVDWKLLEYNITLFSLESLKIKLLEIFYEVYRVNSHKHFSFIIKNEKLVHCPILAAHSNNTHKIELFNEFQIDRLFLDPPSELYIIYK